MRPNHAAPTDANLSFISLEYPYEELRRATNNFSQDNVLGTGTYGCVYRGQLKDGTEVAVKVLQAPKESGFKEEVKVLSKFRHANLVILMGFARNGHERCLVYELLSGGDVSSRLQPSGHPSFNWYQRLNVALDAALGLSHLHNATPRVFHRDIKTQNILLDRNGSAKVADFGLACLAEHRSLGHFKVQQCSGTIGYADPAYINTSVVTEKTEVYSFGMVLIELLTARPPAVQDPSTGQILYNFQNVFMSSEYVVRTLTSASINYLVEALLILRRAGEGNSCGYDDLVDKTDNKRFSTLVTNVG
ncbi:serine-threonine protein kinase, plant-type, putative [Perkinsus marinus ATCC 50983]|uniref:Serine-threonine protein kinase, plant-type, putative n=1 Tax=Perkinsus marinus (strain ATCC 50983 / TXsc) TaxID=423536 RepID=C5LB31_PERM5|nr:serine-threonine protein kinase, plant-type, putative [Perkinsus marinus ATCC 50983]EER05959.1 serine-threonine protein kinase, plant-type, putative [Perkinsus marinus ATCC 50983]|eukprot:XP_002774143.1 serine-threonine protein kinase, plant-type, putative [Perkinsus marinus ATCC 50983]